VFFQRQRASADAGNPETAKRFYDMMQRIGNELQRCTGILTVPKSQENPNLLDLCMAPGGFLHAAMELNRHASATAYSLPVEDGGHKVLLPGHHSVKVKLLDITMLAADLGFDNIPKEHPDRNNFLPREFGDGRVFDMVFCDGQVLRNHKRAAYREKREARRLTVTQLALGLEHVKPGGTIIILLHKLEAVDTVELLCQFNHFSSITLFKPAKCHAKRSSFYMVASNIQTEHPEAITAIHNWKHTWAVATFGGEEDYGEIVRRDNSQAERILDDFGSELVRLGRKIWDIQARALANAPFITGSSVRTGPSVQ
jgi:23S rRNA U2552 (ribose-2'-O)-methylase RlmE/FtsJ